MNTENKRRGRPKSGSGTTKTESILLRLDPGEKQAFTDAAKASGISLSSWMRERLRRVACRELEEMNQPIAFLSRRE